MEDTINISINWEQLLDTTNEGLYFLLYLTIKDELFEEANEVKNELIRRNLPTQKEEETWYKTMNAKLIF